MADSSYKLRIIPLSGGLNFRDLGGYVAAGGRRVRWLRVFRSGTTHFLNDADRAYLEALGIRSVFDLRAERERQEHPHGMRGLTRVLYQAVDHNRSAGQLLQVLSSPQFTAAQMRDAMLHLYRDLPYEFSDVYGRLFRSLASGPLPLVFNCNAGKDRTGIAAALLLSALGVSWGDVVYDYLLTESFVPDIIRIFRHSTMGELLGQFSPSLVAPVFSAHREYLETARTAIIERSGSIEGYLQSQLNLETSVIETLRRRLLE